MKHLFISATIFCLAGLSYSCDDSLLIVGGQDESGPLSSMHLLTPSGWCQHINFPALPQPVINPGVHIFRAPYPDAIDIFILIVCGFDNNLCQWTQNGSDEWKPLAVLPSESDEKYVSTSRSFQILPLDEFRNLVMVSTMEGENFVGNTHTLNVFQGFPSPWVPAEDQTAQFNLQAYMENYGWFNKNMTGSCLAKRGQELILTGGSTDLMPAPTDELSSVELSEPTVARKSLEGINWEMDVVPDLIEGRENHACLGTQLYGNEVVIVGGGNKYSNMNGSNGYSQSYFYRRQTFETLDSVEVLQDNKWTSGPNFNIGRLGLGLGEICGEVMAMGGRRYDGEYLYEANRTGGVNGPAHWTHTVHDNIQETFLDTIETLKGISWMISENKMPGPMASFGVAKAPLSLCKDY